MEDDYLFDNNVRRCKSVKENTTYLEMFSYSDPSLNSVEEHVLSDQDFEDFLYRKGVFSEPTLPDGVSLLGGVRMVLQKDAQHPETFTPHVISLKPDIYIEMAKAWHLSYRAIENTCCVGPFFWSTIYEDEDDNSYLQVVQRKSDIRREQHTRGWELMLSHEFRTRTTTGFCKGTPSSDIVQCIQHLKACLLQINHPLLLPLIICAHDITFKTEIKQREARDRIRRIECALSMHGSMEDQQEYLNGGVFDLELVSRDMIKCHAEVFLKAPAAYLLIIDSFKEAMGAFFDQLPEDRRTSKMKRVHASVLSRLEFWKNKWHGIEIYSNTTLQRLDVQRHSLMNLFAQKESRLNFRMAGDQRKLAHASKRDSTAMKTISLLGTIFLPGAYLASIFSTTFFDFQHAPDIASAVSPDFWFYWVVTIPVTLLIVGMWLFWERRRHRIYDMEDHELELSAKQMENEIMERMWERRHFQKEVYRNF